MFEKGSSSLLEVKGSSSLLEVKGSSESDLACELHYSHAWLLLWGCINDDSIQFSPSSY